MCATAPTAEACGGLTGVKTDLSDTGPTEAKPEGRSDVEQQLAEERAENARLKDELRQVCKLNSEAREFIRHLRKEGGRS